MTEIDNDGFPDVTWVTESSHPASGLAYQVAEVNAWPGDPHFVPGQFARVLWDSMIMSPPQRNTTEVYRIYNRSMQAAIENMEAAAAADGMSSRSYAEYELTKIDKSRDLRVKFWDSRGGETRKIRVTPATMAKIAAILREAPENQW